MYKRKNNAGPIGPAVAARVVSGILVAVVSGALYAQALQLPETQLRIRSHTIKAEIAQTEASRNYGLMNRASLAKDHGMLFVFDTVGRPCFWMKNTPLPLSIAFIDVQGVIVNMADMMPHSTNNHCPKRPVRYALEMSQGWFQEQGIEAGDHVKGLPDISHPATSPD